MKAVIRAITYALPEAVLTNHELAAEFPEWTAERIQKKTGIATRHIAGAAECSSDLGVKAAGALFKKGACRAEDIDYLLFCTQSPDYVLPTTACIVQDRLGLPTRCGALDFNLGCSGFVYGLSLAKGLIETGQARKVLLITAETYSKYIHPRDKSVKTLFGDAAAATLIECAADDSEGESIGPFVFGTDGSGFKNLIVPIGGRRELLPPGGAVTHTDSNGNMRSDENLYMNGGEIFNFTLKAVPQSVNQLLEESGSTVEEVDLFVFHQANQFMLEHLRKKMNIPAGKFWISMDQVGNTVSSTIPIALAHAVEKGVLRKGSHVMLVGFGVGYSWAATMIRWK